MTDSDDFRGLRRGSGDDEQSMGVNYMMLEVNLARCDDVYTQCEQGEGKEVPISQKVLLWKGQGPLRDQKKLLACPMAWDAPEGRLLLNSSCVQKHCSQRTQNH